MAEKPLIHDANGPYKLVQARHGLLLANPNDVYLGAAVLKYGEYGEHEAALLRQLLVKPGRVVEVGANAGFLTLPLAQAAAARGELVHAFEPQPFLFQNLCANMALNALDNVRTWPFACGEENGVVYFAAPNYLAAGNFGGVSVDAPAGGTTMSAPAVQLDEFLGGEQVSLLKVDVEGHELKVLKGANALLKTQKPFLYVENDRLDRSRELIEHVMALGYRLWWHIPPLYNPENFFGDAQNIYGNLASFNMIGVPRETNVEMTGFAEITDASAHPLAQAT